MKETKFLAPILLESPLMFEILEKIRDRHSIDKLDPMKDPYKQRVRQDMEQDPPIDWQAVRQDLEAEIRAIPDLLPSEFAAFQKILEAKKTLPAEPSPQAHSLPTQSTSASSADSASLAITSV